MKSLTLSYSLNLKYCSEFFLSRGFHIYDHNDSKLVMLKPGTIFSTSIKRVPLELSIERQGEQSEVTLSYGTFVLFDTGDLKKELLRIVNQIEINKHELA